MAAKCGLKINLKIGFEILEQFFSSDIRCKMMSKKPWYETAWIQTTYAQFLPEWQFVEERAKEIIESVHLKPGMKILDMACGSGAETTALAIMG